MSDIKDLIDTNKLTEAERLVFAEKTQELKLSLTKSVQNLSKVIKAVKSGDSSVSLVVREVKLALPEEYWNAHDTLTALWKLNNETPGLPKDEFATVQANILKLYSTKTGLSLEECLSSQFVMDALLNITVQIVQADILQKLDHLVKTGDINVINNLKELLEATGFKEANLLDELTQERSDDDPEAN
jgi:hypothetical protein